MTKSNDYKKYSMACFLFLRSVTWTTTKYSVMMRSHTSRYTLGLILLPYMYIYAVLKLVFRRMLVMFLITTYLMVVY